MMSAWRERLEEQRIKSAEVMVEIEPDKYCPFVYVFSGFSCDFKLFSTKHGYLSKFT